MVGARQSEKKIRSTHHELRMGAKILEFHQDFGTEYCKFLGLVQSSPRLGSGLDLIPGLMSLGFVKLFDITVIR